MRAATYSSVRRQHERALSKRAIRAKVKAEMRETYGTSWFCDPCKVEVHDRRCRHCGKTEREPR